jgi:transposase
LEVEELRDLVRYRKTLVKEVSRNKCRVKSFLYKHGILIPPTINIRSGHWSNKYTQWLKTIETSTNYGSIQLEDIIETTIYLRKKLLKITRKLREISKSETYKTRYNLLCSIPGVSLITSMTILSEIDDINRFSNLDKLCSYIGLVPSTNSSGESEKVGNISKRANGILRSAIVESAWIASATDPALILAFTELKKRMKANRAVIRIAKKLVNRIRYVLKNEAEYIYAVL